MKAVTLGSSGTDVAVCQAILNGIWMTDSEGKFLEPDGIFGSRTFEAVKRFQSAAKANGLYDGQIDGIFGPKCWKAVGY